MEKQLHYEKYYSGSFQDVNVLVIFGFGFLLASFKRYGFSSTGFNLLIATLGVQWAVLVEGFLFASSAGKVKISLHSVLKATISVTAVLISAGALLGKANPIQLIWMAMVEVAAFSTNRWINVRFLKIEEHTSLMHVHIFGTYFGLAVSWWLYHPSLSKRIEKETSNLISDLFSMLGTLFLWMFWPSFNSVLIVDVMEKRNAICNTYYAIAVSAVAGFALSSLSSGNGKIRMEPPGGVPREPGAAGESRGPQRSPQVVSHGSQEQQGSPAAPNASIVSPTVTVPSLGQRWYLAPCQWMHPSLAVE
ncbi:Ammonium transporter Rh type B-B [Chelonia mydas]|uniref:Ammonium transporter Rh type B-B n=1 Tax=Chelonia mydas TaxID=8469 RepID=M7ATM5_CHEMY|nr:Ammonium transporter Rh type B-B [Chelonia mydas]